jgi:hypothetical protein
MKRGSALIVKRQKPLSIDKFFFTAPPRSKGFCFAKTLFHYPHSWGNEPLVGAGVAEDSRRLAGDRGRDYLATVCDDVWKQRPPPELKNSHKLHKLPQIIGVKPQKLLSK